MFYKKTQLTQEQEVRNMKLRVRQVYSGLFVYFQIFQNWFENWNAILHIAHTLLSKLEGGNAKPRVSDAGSRKHSQPRLFLAGWLSWAHNFSFGPRPLILHTDDFYGLLLARLMVHRPTPSFGFSNLDFSYFPFVFLSKS